MFFQDRAVGFERFRDLTYKVSERFVTEHDVSISCKKSLLLDAFESAAESICFHNIDLDQTNQFKEIGHAAFWLAKLKPFRIAPPGENVAAFQAAWEIIAGSQSKEDASKLSIPRSKKLSALQKKASDYSVFPLNEWIAVITAVHLAEVCWCDQLDRISDKGFRAIVLDRVEFLRNRFYTRSADMIANSLRFHTFSARGLAITFEAMLDINIDVEDERT